MVWRETSGLAQLFISFSKQLPRSEAGLGTAELVEESLIRDQASESCEDLQVCAGIAGKNEEKEVGFCAAAPTEGNG